MDTSFYQSATKKNIASYGSFVPRFCRKKWILVGEKRALCTGELAQQDDGSCLGHGFRLSLWKAAFEPHVSLLKIVMFLSSPRNMLELTSLLLLQA